MGGEQVWKQNPELVFPQAAFRDPSAHTTARRGSLFSPPVIPDSTLGGQASELRVLRAGPSSVRVTDSVHGGFYLRLPARCTHYADSAPDISFKTNL